MRKIVIVAAAALGFASVPLAAGALSSSDPPQSTACAGVHANVNGNAVDRDVCAPTSQVPPPPTVPLPPVPPPTPPLPVPVPPVSPPPPPVTPPSPPVPVPVPPLPVGTQAQAAAAGCQFTSARPTPPPAGESTLTLPDGTVLYESANLNAQKGYGGGSGPLGTLEISGNGPGNYYGGGHSNVAPLDGYVSTSGGCLNGTSIP